jgi:GNAT superfamily N-acetyltransferase
MILPRKKQNNPGAQPEESSDGIELRPLTLADHWRAVGHMYQNYPGVDSNFDQMLGPIRQPFLRWVGMPLYFRLLNGGWGLWLWEGNKAPQLAGQLFLQHRKMVTHINDIEVNKAFQGRKLSHKLLTLAETQARLHRKSYLTLAVTLSNSRAVNLYRQSGFLDQHHHYYYLSRPWWSDPAGEKEAVSGVKLVPLKRAAARRNLNRFFRLETREGEPLVAPVWEALYRPELPRRGEGFSFALYFGDKAVPQGHVDFFDWSGRGRWRIYLDPALWSTPQEKLLFAALLRQSRGYSQLGLMLGSTPHHQAARSFTRDLGLVERDTERMLMIKPLSKNVQR